MKIRYNKLVIFVLILLVSLLSFILGILELHNRLHVYVLAFAVLSYLFLIVYFRHEGCDVFAPAFGMVVLVFLYSTISALYVEENGKTWHGDYISDHVMNVYYVTCLMGLAGFILGTLFSQNTRSRFEGFKSILVKNHLFYDKLFAAALVLSVLLCFQILPLFDFTNVLSYAERALPLRVERMEDIASGVSEALFVALPITLILCGATFFMFHKRLYLKVLGFVVIISYLMQNTLAGWRGQVIAAAIIPVIYYHYRIRRIELKKALLLGFFAFLFMNIMSAVRGTSDPFEMAHRLVYVVQGEGFLYTRLKRTSELMVGSNLQRLISGIEDNETSFTYGTSFVTELMVYIPRALYPARPLPLSEQFVEVFCPGLREAGGGRGFFILQEGYWAFGMIGVFFSMMIYGWLLETIYRWIIRHIHLDIIVFIYTGIYYSLVVSSVRTGIVSSFKGMLMGLIPFIVVVYFPFTLRNVRNKPVLAGPTDQVSGLQAD